MCDATFRMKQGGRYGDETGLSLCDPVLAFVGYIAGRRIALLRSQKIGGNLLRMAAFWYETSLQRDSRSPFSFCKLHSSATIFPVLFCEGISPLVLSIL